MTGGLSKWDFSLAKQETAQQSLWSRWSGISSCVCLPMVRLMDGREQVNSHFKNGGGKEG